MPSNKKKTRTKKKTIPAPNRKVSARKSYSGVLTVRTAPSVHGKLTVIARKNGVSLNNLISGLLKEKAGYYANTKAAN